MALARTDYSQTTNNFSSYSSLTSGSFTPPDNSLVVLFAYGQKNDVESFRIADCTISNSGTSLVWTRRSYVDNVNGAYDTGGAFWTAPVVTGASITVTITKNALQANAVAFGMKPMAYTGHNVVSPVGAILEDSASNDGAYSGSLSAAPASDSEVLASMFSGIEGAGDVVPVIGTGWSTVQNFSNTANNMFCIESRTGSTSTSVGYDDSRGPSSTDIPYLPHVIALEIKAAGGGGDTPSKLRMTLLGAG